MSSNTLYQPIIDSDEYLTYTTTSKNSIKYETDLDISHIIRNVDNSDDYNDDDIHDNTLNDDFRNSTNSNNDSRDSDFEQLVVSFMYDRDYVGINQTACNIAYTIINASLVSLPFTAYNVGIPLFIILMIFMSMISSYIVIIVVQMANEKRVRTLEDLAEVCGGPRFFLGVCIFQIIFSFSMMCIALLVWADISSTFFSDNNVTNFILSTRTGQVLLGSALVLPVCLFTKSMLSLKWSAIIIVFSLLFCVITVFITYYSDATHSFGSNLEVITRPKTQWWLFSPFIIYYYSYNQRAFVVYRCLKRRNTARWRSAVHKANIGVTILYIIFGIIGYLSLYRNDTEINNFNYFLINKGENKVAYDVVKIVLSLSFLLTIPVDCLIVQSTFRKLYRRYFKNIASSLKSTDFHKHHHNKEDDNDNATQIQRDSDPEVVIYNSELHSKSSVIDMDDGWSTFSTEVLNTRSPDIDIKEGNNSQLRSHVVDTSSIRTSQPLDDEEIESNIIQDIYNSNEFHLSESSNTNTSSTTVLRKPSKDEIDQILLANNATRRNKLITILDADGGGGDSINRLDSSWASVMSRDATAATGQVDKGGYHTLPLSRGISSYTNNTNTIMNNNNALHNMSTSKLAAFVLWIILLATCILVKQWMYLAASVGTFCSAVLLFLFPTMLYFRMSLPSDYQASPILFGLVPNRLYMTLIQILGICFIVFNIFAIMFLLIQGRHAIQDNSEK